MTSSRCAQFREQLGRRRHEGARPTCDYSSIEPAAPTDVPPEGIRSPEALRYQVPWMQPPLMPVAGVQVRLVAPLLRTIENVLLSVV